MTNDSGVKVLWDSLRGSVIDSKGREMSGSVRFAAPAALAVALLFAAVAAMSLPAAAQALQLRIANESGVHPEDVHVTITGDPFEVSGMTNDVPKTLKEIEEHPSWLDIAQLVSGRVYISYYSAVHEPELGTLFRSPTRFDWAELTVTPNSADKANLTAVEQSGIGMRLDTYDGAEQHLDALRSANSDTIFAALQEIPGGPEATVRDSKGNIVRVISPQKAETYPDLANAYPELGDYVRSMAGQTIALRTAFFGPEFTTSSYAGTFAADGSITLTGTSDPPEAAPAQIYLQGDELIADIYTGEHTPNNLEGTIRRDVLSGFSAGFWGGRYGNHAIDFCTTPATDTHGIWCPEGFNQPAFGAARTSLSPFPTCEQYAAVIDKYADMYGNPYSDASGKVQISLDQPGTGGEVDTLRLTILPDSGDEQPSTGGNPNCGAAAPVLPPAAASAAPPAASTAAPPAARVKLFKLFKKARVKGARARVGRIVCAGRCGRLKLIAKKGRKVLGRGRASVKGSKAALMLRLTKPGKRLLARKGRLKARVTVWVTPPGGKTVRHRRAVLLIDKPARKQRRR